MTFPSPTPTLRPHGEVRHAPELAVVVPVFRAHEQVAGLIANLGAALGEADWEVVFVDDNSPDDTVTAIATIAASDRRVRVMRRVGRNGLTQTCLAAMLASGAHAVALMDQNSRGDAALLVAMLERVRQDADLAIAARPGVPGGAFRATVRNALSGATRWVLSADLTDPASGLFVMRREALERLTPLLSSLGYQVLLDLLATARGSLRVVEVAGSATGNPRSELKLAIELFALLIAKLSNDAVSIRFLLFCLVGLSGVGAHLGLLYAALLALPFTSAQTVATIGAMAWNFTLNNAITYGDQRLTGWAYVSGMLRFMVVCGIGAISNVGVASWIYANDQVWWIAGLGGAVMGAVWNYAVSSVFVWRPR